MSTTHGMSGTKEYWIWAAMLDRCRNPKSRQYRDYGGRGIKVCERWQDFAAFMADMGLRTSASLTIERRDNQLDYGPDNCFWAPRSVQAKNKTLYRKNSCGVAGVHAVRGKWRARIRVDGALIHLGYFATLDDAASARKAATAAYGFNPGHGGQK